MREIRGVVYIGNMVSGGGDYSVEGEQEKRQHHRNFLFPSCSYPDHFEYMFSFPGLMQGSLVREGRNGGRYTVYGVERVGPISVWVPPHMVIMGYRSSGCIGQEGGNSCP